MAKAMWRRTMLCFGLLAGALSACSDDDATGSGGTGSSNTGGAGGSGGSSAGTSGTAGTGAGTGGAAGGGGDAGTQACQIELSLGRLSGKSEESTCAYLGIPYGKPPVGDLRFAAPQPADGWQGVRDTTMFGPSCMQAASAVGGASTRSEDCLSLNVYTPEPAPSAKLPVMVFIHGGGYTLGSSSTYDGHLLSQKGPVVVVTMNYRLGVFGFFAHPALDSERADAPSGSDGIRDQQLALRWVKDNISAFQGDANNVTVFGESAGSFSATLHLVSPGSRDLAHHFILESGAAVGGGYGTTTRDAGYALSTSMASELCAGAPNVVACLRAKPAQELVDWTGGATGIFGAAWGPVVEGRAGGVLPDSPQNLIANDDYNRAASVIAGSNKNEWGLFQQPVLGGTPITTMAEFKANLAQQFGARAAEVEAHYTVASDAEANDVFIRLVTDATFRCPTRVLARLTTAHGTRFYLYSFEEGVAYHGDELAYVFGTPVFTGIPPQAALVATTQSYWTRFAVAGDPNASGLPMWPMYDSASDQHLVLKNPPAIGSALAKSDCDFWERFNP
ncbi:MAG TPA: carboxylesterase/lipase family protein [Polyangiaceae bacterium]|nr:carboxylesterase/lipase family protein [Polyangiaceae bacterium]